MKERSRFPLHQDLGIPLFVAFLATLRYNISYTPPQQILFGYGTLKWLQRPIAVQYFVADQMRSNDHYRPMWRGAPFPSFCFGRWPFGCWWYISILLLTTIYRRLRSRIYLYLYDNGDMKVISITSVSAEWKIV